MASYRLDNKPWITVVRTNGTADDVSLQDIFLQAPHILSFSGSPLEIVALTRFLLAIIHLTDTPTSLASWKKLWDSRESLMQRCAAYVRTQGDAWDLLHDQHPFGQSPPLSKTRNPCHLLLYESARMNNPVFSDHSLGEKPAERSWGALVRGMLVTNAFAGSSGGGYRSGPLAMRSIGMLQGDTLDQTLLLNLLVQKESPAPFDWKLYGAPANGQLDLVRRYLWTARKIRFLSNCEMMVAPGNEMGEGDRADEPMVVMRRDKEGKGYIPLRLDAGRALWRSAHVLLNFREDAKSLASVDQLQRLQNRDLFPDDQTVRIRVCAVAGDAQGPATELWRDETLYFGRSVISDDSRYATLVRSINDAEETATRTRARIYAFAAKYLQDGGTSQPDKTDVGRLLDELSPGLSDYWSAIGPAGERIALDDFEEKAWANLIKHAAEVTVRRAIDRLPADARRFRAEFQPSTGENKKKGVRA